MSPARSLACLLGATCASLAALLLAHPTAHAETKTHWRIGTADGAGAEFTAGSVARLVYEVEAAPGPTAWRQDQASANTGAPAYTIRFALAVLPKVSPVLELDGFFTTMAPETGVVTVNGTEGRFQIRPRFGPATDYEQGNATTFSLLRIRAPIDRSLLRIGRNEIALSFTGITEKLTVNATVVENRIGTVSYDTVALVDQAAEAPAVAASVEPTLFFQRRGPGLVELTDVVVRHRRPFARGRVSLRVGAATVSTDLRASRAAFGEEVFALEVPAVDQPTPYTLEVELDGEVHRSSGEFRPARRWTLFATLQNHSDIGYTDYQPDVQELHNRNVDDVVRILDEHPQHKFVLESTWLAENFLSSREPGPREKLLRFAREGRVEISPFFLNLLTGLCTGEELYRSLYPAKQLQRAHGIPLRAASMTDVPTHSWFLPGLLADAGIGGLSIGSNQHRGQILLESPLAENSPFYWEGADGRKILVWYARVYGQLLRLLGDQGSPERLRRSLPQFMTRFVRDDYPLDSLLLYGLYGDNMEIRDGEVTLFRDWNQQYAYPRLIASTHAEYFDHVRASGARLPTYRGDGGAYWEDGAGSSAAETARNRETQRLLPPAEVAATLATLLAPSQQYPQSQFTTAWKDLLFYDEHTWGANRSITQPDRDIVRGQWMFKRAYADRANLSAHALWLGAMDRLVRHISVEGQTLFVFNSDAVARSSVIQTDLDPGTSLTDPSTGQSLKLRVVRRHDGFETVRFVVPDVPALGYRAFTLGRGRAAEASTNRNSWEISSRHYRLRVDPATGAIAELEDLALRRQLVDASAPFKLNQVVHVSGGEGTRVVNNNLAPEAELKLEGAGGAVLVRNTGDSLTVHTRAPHLPTIETTITLYDDLRRVDIVNRLVKEETRAKEAVYFAFPFDVGRPQLSVESQAGWVRPNEDQLPGAAREWFATQNAVVARGDGVAVVWASPDTPLVTLTDINRGRWVTDLPVSNAHIYAYAMNNYWVTNYKAAQSGEFQFRFSLTSAAAIDPVAASRFSADTRSPPLAFQMVNAGSNRVRPAQRALPLGHGAFFEIDAGHAQISAFKPAEDGDGFILRLREIGGSAGTVKLTSPWFPLLACQLTNALEDNTRALTVTDQRTVDLPIEPFRFATFRLRLGRNPELPP